METALCLHLMMFLWPQSFWGKRTTWFSMPTIGFLQGWTLGVILGRLSLCLKVTGHGSHSWENQSPDPWGPREMYPQTWESRCQQTWRSEPWTKKTCLSQERHIGSLFSLFLLLRYQRVSCYSPVLRVGFAHWAYESTWKFLYSKFTVTPRNT